MNTMTILCTHPLLKKSSLTTNIFFFLNCSVVNLLDALFFTLKPMIISFGI